MPASSPHRKSASGGWLRHVRRRPRFNAAAVGFVLALVILLLLGVPPGLSLLFAFDGAAILFLGLLAHLFAAADAAAIRQRAREEDQGRWSVLLIGISVSSVVLVALGLELHAATGDSLAQIALAAGTLLLSWLFMNALFSVHYAHLYYGDGAGAHQRGGLQFPGSDDRAYQPDYWDFAYFALVLGMTFQVSDVQINDRGMRRIALLHGVIAFFFNVIIIAISVNVVAGKA